MISETAQSMCFTCTHVAASEFCFLLQVVEIQGGSNNGPRCQVSYTGNLQLFIDS